MLHRDLPGDYGPAKAFPGRVILDHLPKTGGHAVNAWLRSALGNGAVTAPVTGTHPELVRRWGGLYSVISAHVWFDGRGLDPRYQYVTCLREPIDRAASWLYFVLNNHQPDQLQPGLWQEVRIFVQSDGAEVSDAVRGHISNLYVHHFADINATTHRSDEERLADSLAAIARYDLRGCYERLPQFVADLSELLQIPAPPQLDRVNVTWARPDLADMTPALRERLTEMNQLDLKLYHSLCESDPRPAAPPSYSTAPLRPRWQTHPGATNRVVETSDLMILSVSLPESNATVTEGASIRFDLRFSLHRPVGELLVGLHIFDEDFRCAFGTNSKMLGQPLLLLQPGIYTVGYQISAYLPEGRYHAGFAFVDASDGRLHDLAWFDRLVSFTVRATSPAASCGYARVPTRFTWRHSDDSRDPSGN